MTSSLTSSQSIKPSHLQLADRHCVLDLQDHWKSAQSSRATEQFWEEKQRRQGVTAPLPPLVGCPVTPLQDQQHLLVAAVHAVQLAVTQPLWQQTLFAALAAQLGGAGYRVAAALLIRPVAAVRVAVAVHGGLHTLPTGALEVGRTAALVLWGGGKHTVTAPPQGCSCHFDPSELQTSRELIAQWPLKVLQQKSQMALKAIFTITILKLSGFLLVVPHWASSLPSRQSLSPSHRKLSGMQRLPLSQWCEQPSPFS